MKRFGAAALAILVSMSTFAAPQMAAAQYNGPIPHQRDADRVRPEDRRPDRHHDRHRDDRRSDNRHHDRRHDRRDRDNDLAIGIIGLTTGAIIGGMIADDNRRYAPPPPPPPRFRPPVREYRYVKPWSPQWHRWCATRYRSFNPHTGMFIGFDGRRQFCDANL